MRGRIHSLLFLSLLGSLVVASTLPAQGKKEADALTKKLEKKISLQNGIEANTPLKDALMFLAAGHDLTIVVDTKAFQKAGIDKVEEQPIKLKPVKDVALGKVLQTLLDQVGGTYKVDKDKVVLQPKAKK